MNFFSLIFIRTGIPIVFSAAYVNKGLAGPKFNTWECCPMINPLASLVSIPEPIQQHHNTLTMRSKNKFVLNAKINRQDHYITAPFN